MIDAASFARQLVGAERAGLDQQYLNLQTLAKGKISAYQAIDTKVDDLNAVLKTLTDSSSLQASKTSVTQDGFVNATAGNGVSNGNYTVEISQLAQAHQLGLDFAAETWVAPTNGTLDLSVGGNNMSLDLSTLSAGADLLDLRNAINNASDNPGIQAAVIRTGSNVKLVFSSEESGAANTLNINLSGGTGTAYNELNTAIAGQTELTVAQDAKLKFSGIDIVSSSNKVENIIDNLTLDLTQTNVGNPVTLSIARDDDAISTNMQTFVDAYNSLTDEVKKVNLSSGESYVPLSGDATTRSLTSQVRNIFSNLPSGNYLSQLGLEFDRNGKLSLDKEGLETSLEKDPAILDTLLLGSDGLATKLTTALEPYTKSNGIFDNRISSLNDELTRIDEKTEKLDLQMENVYQRYLSQFTLMNQLEAQMEQTATLFSTSA